MQKNNQQQPQIQHFELIFRSNSTFKQLQQSIEAINLTLYNYQKQFDRIQKQLKQRSPDYLLTQCDLIVANRLQVDPLLLKEMIKMRKNYKFQNISQQLQQLNPLKRSASDLGSKINLLNEMMSYLHEIHKIQEKRLQQFKQSTQNKFSEIQLICQKKIVQNSAQQNLLLENIRNNQKSKALQLIQKMKMNEAKIFQQLSNCKQLLLQKPDYAFLTKSLHEFYQMKQKQYQKQKFEQLYNQSSTKKSPLKQLENRVTHLQSDYNKLTIEENIKFKNLMEKMEMEMVKKFDFSQWNSVFEKRFSLIHNNFTDLLSRINIVESSQKDVTMQVKIFSEINTARQKQMKRIQTILINIKLNQDFFRIIQSLDANKILQTQNRLFTLQQHVMKNITEQLNIHRKQIEKIKTKINYLNDIDLQQELLDCRVNKQKVQEMVQNFLEQNQYINKIQYLKSQFLDHLKIFQQSSILIEKKINKLQKDSQGYNHMKVTQQFLKREILILSGKVAQLQVSCKEEKKRLTSSSRRDSIINVNSSSNNLKKLYETNYGGTFPNFVSSNGLPNQQIQETIDSKKRILSALTQRQKQK